MFVLTDNMIALDSKRVMRCFDLKGSMFSRYVPNVSDN